MRAQVSLLSKIGTWAGSLRNLFYPNQCVACGRELVAGESQLCIYCEADIPRTDYHLLPENYATQLFAGRFVFQNACAWFYFRGGKDRYRRMIHQMKYSSRRDIARLLGARFGAELRQSRLYDSVDILVPIPLHWTRRITRGYNQSEEICRGMSQSMGIPYDFGALKRRRITPQQARRSRAERWKNVSGAFRVSNIEALHQKHILLVDDVLTTGSTIEACAVEITNSVPNVRLSIATLAVAKRNIKTRSGGISESKIFQ